jgi:hypothetical protein
MATEYLAKVLLHRFLRVQDFAERLAELGAPASVEALLELARCPSEQRPTACR